MHRFDIEVEGSHNYLADGVVVHNSPETTPGGRALKFYSSIRLDIRRIEAIKDGAEVTGNRTRVKVVKNKCVAAGTKVFDPPQVRRICIEDIVERRRRPRRGRCRQERASSHPADRAALQSRRGRGHRAGLARWHDAVGDAGPSDVDRYRLA